jgi:type IV pilus assembly protein PilE
MQPRNQSRGFTLIELLVAVAVVAILAGVAIPAYTSYVFRSRLPVGLDALSAFQTRMEQRYQDVGNYGTGAACGLAATTAKNFAVSCALTSAGQGFTATATGSGPVAGVVYSIDEQGTRKTVSHPKGVPAQNCWSLRGGACDS